MRVFLNRLPVSGPWGGGGHFINNFYKFAPKYGVELVSHPLSAEIILLAGLDSGDTGCGAGEAIKYKTMSGGSIKVVIRVNENDARKGTYGVDNHIVQVIRNSDGVVFVSNWLKEYFRPKAPFTKSQPRGGVFPWFGATEDEARIFDDYSVVINGVDRSVFFPRRPLLLYDCDALRIVAHHWSNNEMKGFDIYEWIDKFCDSNPGYHFHYIGRDRGTFKGVRTSVTPATHGEELGKQLAWPRQRHNVYVSGSRFDPGPNHILEAIASGLDTYVHTDGGGAVEFAGQDHVYSTYDELEKILTSHLLNRENPNAYVIPTWQQCIGSYVEYMKGLMT